MYHFQTTRLVAVLSCLVQCYYEVTLPDPYSAATHFGGVTKYDWLDKKHPQSFPTFTEARHRVLCSELKQLYVAITRMRQRLWICENKGELSTPMFDYWKMRGLVQIRKLDDSVAQAMRVVSSPQEWWERGKKSFVPIA
ncbi:hypothetical protein Tco_0124469 [Tanacetum coccineum]